METFEKLFNSTLSLEEIRKESKKIGIQNQLTETKKNELNVSHLVSIIVPVSRKENIKCLLESLTSSSTYKNYEVLLVTNKGEDLSEIISHFNNISISQFNVPLNISLSIACEIVANISNGSILIFLDSKLQISKFWLEYLLKLYISENANVITSKTIQCNGKIEEAGYSKFFNKLLIGNGFDELSEEPEFNFVDNIPTSSVHSLFLTKNVFNKFEFDENISDFNLSLFSLGININLTGEKIYYQPLSVLQLQELEKDYSEDNSTLQPDRKTLDLLRPTNSTFTRNYNLPSDIKSKVLVLGIYLGDRFNNAVDISHIIEQSKYYDVKQKWTSINKTSSDLLLKKHTINQLNGFLPKFTILNSMLENENIADYEYIIILDDDIIIENNFIDNFLFLQSKYDFSLAQPSRTTNSYVDHPIVQRQNGVFARITNFVEIGPVFSVRNDIFNDIFPFDNTSPMGWGYENIWAKKINDLNKRMGIIDVVQVDHSIRKPVENYNWEKADKQRSELLKLNPHLELEKCFLVKEIIN